MYAFDTIREWATELEAQLTAQGKSITPEAQFLILVTEAAEMDNALMLDDEPQIRDAIGDMAVTGVTLYELARRSMNGGTYPKTPEDAYAVYGGRVEDILDDDPTTLMLIGEMGEGLRRINKTYGDNVKCLISIAAYLQMVSRVSGDLGHDFFECIAEVMVILGGRLKRGYTVSAVGTAER